MIPMHVRLTAYLCMRDGCRKLLGISRLQDLVLSPPGYQAWLLHFPDLLAEAVALGLDEGYIGLSPSCMPRCLLVVGLYDLKTSQAWASVRASS